MAQSKRKSYSELREENEQLYDSLLQVRDILEEAGLVDDGEDDGDPDQDQDDNSEDANY